MRAIEKIQEEGSIEEDNRARYQCKKCHRFVLHLKNHYNTQICRRGDECRKLILSGWLPFAACVWTSSTSCSLLIKKLGVEVRSSDELLRKTGYRTWYPTYALLALLNNNIHTSVVPSRAFAQLRWRESIDQLKQDLAQCKRDLSYALMLYAELITLRSCIFSPNVESFMQDWFEKEDKKYGYKYSRIQGMEDALH